MELNTWFVTLKWVFFVSSGIGLLSGIGAFLVNEKIKENLRLGFDEKLNLNSEYSELLSIGVSEVRNYRYSGFLRLVELNDDEKFKVFSPKTSKIIDDLSLEIMERHSSFYKNLVFENTHPNYQKEWKNYNVEKMKQDLEKLQSHLKSANVGTVGGIVAKINHKLNTSFSILELSQISKCLDQIEDAPLVKNEPK